jgi:hypothetical protein
MFNITLKDQSLPGYAGKLTVEVSVVAIQITEGNLQAQWSIKLPEAGPRLPGSPPATPLFSGSFDMPPPPPIVAGLEAFFKASAPGLLAGLTTKAEAAANSTKAPPA